MKVIQGVYYVVSNDPESHLNPIAIRPKMDESPAQRIEWEDTAKGNVIHIANISFDQKDKIDSNEVPKTITIHSQEGKEIILTLLSKKIFDSFLKDQVASPIPSFQKDADVQNYYLQTSFY